MPCYAIHDQNGVVLRVLNIPEEAVSQQLQPGESAFEGDVLPHHSIDMETMTVVRHELPPEPVSDTPPPEPELPAYAVQRAQLYPTIAEQLDMLWHAMNDGSIPKAEEFYTRIKLVKDLVSKDDTAEPTVIYPIEGVENGNE